MDFTKISLYLERFKNIKPPENELKKIIIKNIKKETNISIKEIDIEINKKFIYIKTTPIIKNEIFYKKQNIIDICEKESGIKINSLQ